ncbi:MAG TPA: hypothetical protein VLA75_07405 [Thermoanaerobaculia bacterium]|nr:hypothetical protein [Thermoanaerobaculia bacterium]
MRTAALALALLAATACLALVLWLSTPWEESAGPLAPTLALAAWVAGPFALLAAAAALARSRAASILALALGLLAAAGGAVVYLDAFVRRPHLLHALVFLPVPILQYPVAAIALAGALLSRRGGRRPQRTA